MGRLVLSDTIKFPQKVIRLFYNSFIIFMLYMLSLSEGVPCNKNEATECQTTDEL